MNDTEFTHVFKLIFRDIKEMIQDIIQDIFAARYKRYAAWPIVIWCRLVDHSNQTTWDFSKRCLRCGDPMRMWRIERARKRHVKQPEFP